MTRPLNGCRRYGSSISLTDSGRKLSSTISLRVSVAVDSCERGSVPRLQRLQIANMVRESLIKSMRPRGRASSRRRMSRKGKGCERRRQVRRTARTHALSMALQRVWRKCREVRRPVTGSRVRVVLCRRKSVEAEEGNLLGERLSATAENFVPAPAQALYMAAVVAAVNKVPVAGAEEAGARTEARTATSVGSISD